MNRANDDAPHVIFCADANYLPYVGVAACSLLLNNPGLKPVLHLITDQPFDAQNAQRFAQLEVAFDVSFHVYVITERDRADLPEHHSKGHLTVATYLRLLIPRTLPETVNRVLYLDADMIIDGDVAPLLATNLDGFALAACADPVGQKLLGNPHYFNSGTMLINLRYWREYEIAKQALDLASRKRLPLFDQDALNAVIPRQAVLALGMEYNYMIFHRLKAEFIPLLEAALRDISAPKILHYTGASKPWQAWYLAPERKKYLDYLRRSPWHDVPGVY